MADFPIVGIGSSAGGLEALQKLFGAMPVDIGIAFVVAAHLDPTRESHLAELLGRCTTMPVVQIGESVRLEPDHVYIIAPDQTLTMRGGVLHPAKPEAPRGHRHPVDAFFRSLAEDQGERAIAIVLSGTGTNGSLGLRFIKAEGGIVIAQEPESAGFTGMLRSAIGTGLVDLVALPEKMPEALANMARHTYVRRAAEPIDPATAEEQLVRVLALVRATTRQDFRGYKNQTLLRRIHRRMGLHQIETLANYHERLRTDQDEAKALAADLTINVTGFFREPEAWSVLAEQVVKPLVRERAGEAPIRIWVAGCSTGEEAYSVAMLIAEQAEPVTKSQEVRVFATDVAAAVLGPARNGTYPSSISQDVTADRLERFFDFQDDTYIVKPALRETITFAPQNLLQDPPFSQLDLISCRNLLIYLEPEFQKRVLALFHFSLREGGHLFLGPAETVAAQEELFHPVSKKWRIFRRIGPTRHDVVDFPLIATEVRTPAQTDADGAAGEPRRRAGEVMEQALLERFAPASVLVDAHFRVQHLRGPTEEYLRPPSGDPSYNLLDMARPGLQAALRTALRQASGENRQVTAFAQVRRGASLHPVRLIVAPVRTRRADELRILVSFFERDPMTATPDVQDPPIDSQLQSDLDSAREDLRLTLEQMEAANEELKASNEEIRSINEELQASNEELETSKEELQSLNEELNTVNHQLESKVSQLQERTADLNNLLNSTDIATLFLDRSLCIRWFTPAMRALLELQASDVGRPVSHFAPRFTGGDLIKDAKRVLAQVAPADDEVVNDQGRWFLRHLLPYRTADERIEGVVVTFVDITARKLAEQELRLSEERFRQFADNSVDVLWIADAATQRLEYLSPAYERVWGQSRELATTDLRSWAHFAHPEDRDDTMAGVTRVLGGQPVTIEYRIAQGGDGENRWIRDIAFPIRDETGTLRRVAGIARDVTEERRTADERELLMHELSHRVRNILAIVQSLANQTDGRAGSAEAYREKFIGRLQAMARAHSLLLEERWRSTDLGDLVEQTLAAYRIDRPEVVEIEGEPVDLTPKQALALSFVLHELGTNAAKYGALSNHDGHLRVSWRVERLSEPRVRLFWQERGGPPVETPGSTGFGTRLIEFACSQELGGELELNYAPDGFTCEVVFPSA